MGGSGGVVQADETYYGNTSKRAKHYKKGHSQKSGVVGLVDQKTGEVRAFAVEGSPHSGNVREILVKHASRRSTLVTDESNLYTFTGKEYAGHQTVLHAGREYVNKAGFTTNNVENFFGQLKRGLRGTFIHVGEQHLQRYLNEFSFRYSNRAGLGIGDQERAAMTLKGIEGKRLTYRSPRQDQVEAPIPF